MWPQETVGAVDLSVIERVTFLANEHLEELFPLGSTVEVAELSKLTNFFLGLNAGRWLTIRMSEVACKSEQSFPSVNGTLQQFASGTGILYSSEAEPPPPDASYLFEHWGLSGNGGVSGQRIVRTAGDISLDENWSGEYGSKL
jgi:hypothetical protein